MPKATCPRCNACVSIRAASVGRWVNCPECSTGFAALPDDADVPEGIEARQPALPPAGWGWQKIAAVVAAAVIGLFALCAGVQVLLGYLATAH